MDAVAVTLSVLLAATFGVSGVAMVRGRPLLGSMVGRAVPAPALRAAGMLELCGSAGLVAGLAAPVAGTMAAGGLGVMSLAAVPVHLRVGDPPAVTAAGLACAVAALGLCVLHALSGSAASP